jgi:surfeit locus 1 family protein
MNAGAEEPRSPVRLALLLMLLAALFAAFVALGTWQMQRRTWKRELIARVEQRVHQAPVPAPARARWPQIGKADEYTPVYLDGGYLPQSEVPVQALTERGAGWWLMAPLRTAQGDIVLINRGFVEPAQRDASARRPVPPSNQHLVGLLRLSEPSGAFLRRNDPAASRWYSRDVGAIAAALQLPAQDVAPYFVDAAAAPQATPGEPIGGLTVLQFHNSHLVYAITWYALAALSAGAIVIVLRRP